MKKIWPYIAAFFAGVSVMAIAALKWFAGDDYKVTVEKIKNKRTQGQGDIVIPITQNNPEKRQKRRNRRNLAEVKKQR